MLSNQNTTNGIPTVGAIPVNNYHPTFIGADGDEGVTVTKHIHRKVYEEIRMMHIIGLKHSSFSTDNHFFMRSVIDPFHGSGLDLSNRYEIKRFGNIYEVQKINGKGKVFKFTLLTGY